ncbi:MAG TPA: (Fe-S)-binding protein [Bradyrhizobium sp.]|uniref:(Fe-S)-binding protein n=1 Tax=Bradyrhizobium sp. TaxID=376 RepID=UPI002C5D73A3|nr:(Fe-S)-binding protein [Bradyrhizobium sp.]HLZ04035.1 (Fe-S)-binding protein [Bradyrhizobium sp.]
MTDLSFEAALNERVGEMLDACTRCGKCVEACPSVRPAGIADASPTDVIAGVIDLVRLGEGSEASRKWASSCMLSGDCIRACDYGVNPRFLLAMARSAMRRKESDLATRRRAGVTRYRETSRDVATLARMQLDHAALERLGQGAATLAAKDEVPDFVFYTGCNVLKTPHIALLALDIMDVLGISYSVMGGPSHCCGVMQFRTGDTEMSGRMGTSSVDKMSSSRSGVLSWCPSCYVQFSETTLPAIERQRGAKPFEMTPFLRFLRGRLDQLRPHLRAPVEMRVALHRHSGVAGIVEAVLELLEAVPGMEIVDLRQPAAGLQSASMSVLPDYKRELQRAELEAAREAGIDALVTIYHSDHRELCAHERDQPFRILNILEVLGQSMGLHRRDRHKELKITQDADLIVRECEDLIAAHALDSAFAREVVVKAMLGDQPLPLEASPRP